MVTINPAINTIWLLLQSLQQAIAPANFAHPQANRQVRLDDAVVAYAFARGKRKTIGFAVGSEGLVVRAPRWTPLGEVDAALREKSGWILRKLQETQQRQQRQDSARIVWCNKTQLPLLGTTVEVHLDPHARLQGRAFRYRYDSGRGAVVCGVPLELPACGRTDGGA